MRKILLTVLLLLLSASWLLAQDNMGKSSMSETTIEGCLSTSTGHYYLTDTTGKKYFLSGYANKLKDHVGHEIKVTGMLGLKTTGTTQQGAASTATEKEVFKVKSVEHVADTCKTM